LAGRGLEIQQAAAVFQSSYYFFNEILAGKIGISLKPLQQNFLV
jgi:hypothetical protein